MTRKTYVYRPDHPLASANGHVLKELVENEEYAKGGVPNVISDIMDETRHMIDGKYYTSKSEFRKVTKQHGCIEVGNEVPTMTKPRKPIELDRRARREDIKRSIYDLKNGKR